MRIIKPLTPHIEEMLRHYEQNGHLNMQASLLGKQSAVYKVQEYCLKVYTKRGKVGGELECEAMMSLQNNRHVPKVYAYSTGNFILTEWIDGFNLRQYREIHGHIPHNLIYDMFSSELQQIQSGYRDWDVIRYENLLWTKGGEVKRTDFWLCEPAGLMQNDVQQAIIRKIDRVYSGDRSEMQKLEPYFYRHGLTVSEIQQALEHFHSQGSSLVVSQ
ncbi:AarF/UbiB family protein [Paenibacillus xylanilyticus]|uniref:AarF/UbiB family protein n=1 Tax=Paenibacillus xylanilyticus TaxID=248903 RepID=UPI00399EF00E